MLRIFPVLGFTQNFLLSWLVQKMVCDRLFFYLLSSDRLLKGKALFCPFFLCKVHLHCMLSHLECTVALDSKINIIILMTFLFRKSPLQQSMKCCSWPWVGWDVTNNIIVIPAMEIICTLMQHNCINCYCNWSIIFLCIVGTVRIWQANTYRLESTLNYGLERVWSMAMLKGSNNVALGYDEGSILIKVCWLKLLLLFSCIHCTFSSPS